MLARLDRWGREDADREVRSRQTVQGTLDAVSRQVENLTKLRVRDMISDEEFTKEREVLQNERRRLAQRLDAQDGNGWFEPARLLVSFSNRAVSWFSEGNREVKRLILAVAGLNPALIDRQLRIDARKPFRRRSEVAKIPLGWSLVKDVRTLWHARDQELLEMIAALQRLSSLAEPAKAGRAV